MTRRGSRFCFLTMVQDINDRKQAEDRLAAAQEALRVSEERYRTAFQIVAGLHQPEPAERRNVCGLQ